MNDGKPLQVGDRVRYLAVTGRVADPDDPATQQPSPGHAPEGLVWVWYDQPIGPVKHSTPHGSSVGVTYYGSWLDPTTLERL